jgi:hypothetical protein
MAKTTINIPGIVPTTRGNLITAGASGIQQSLAAGTAGQLLQTQGTSANAQWVWGGTVQTITSTTSTASGLLAGTFPNDNTIPQVGEGVAIPTLSAAITPKSGSHTLIIRYQLSLSCTANDPFTVAMFTAASADAVASFFYDSGVANARLTASGEFIVSAASTAARTYTLRIGGTGVTDFYLNRATGGAVYGGTLQSSLIVQEVS